MTERNYTTTSTRYGGGGEYLAGIYVEVTAHAHSECPTCGERLDRRPPARYACIDGRTGRRQGEWSQEHGCGERNAPLEVNQRINLRNWGISGHIIDPEIARVEAELYDEMDRLVASRRVR